MIYDAREDRIWMIPGKVQYSWQRVAQLDEKRLELAPAYGGSDYGGSGYGGFGHGGSNFGGSDYELSAYGGPSDYGSEDGDWEDGDSDEEEQKHERRQRKPSQPQEAAPPSAPQEGNGDGQEDCTDKPGPDKKSGIELGYLDFFMLGPEVISHLPARGAADVLQDINKGFRTNLADYMGVDPIDDEGNEFRGSMAELYARHGWPDQFDGDAFEVGLERLRVAQEVKDEGQDPLQASLEEAQQRADNGPKLLAKYEKMVADARDERKEWKARWQVLWATLSTKCALAQVEEIKGKIAQRDAAGGADSALVREYRLLLRNSQFPRIAIARRKEMVARDDDEARRLRADIRRLEKAARIMDKALEAARADVERQYPGMNVDELASEPSAPGKSSDAEHERRASAKKKVQSLEATIKSYNEWKETVPEHLRDVRATADQAIAFAESDLELYRAHL